MGAKQGRTKGNEQRTEYAKPERSGRETGRGKTGRSEGDERNRSLDGKPTVRRKVRRAERKKQRAE